MENKYRKVQIVGKGNFGHAVLVQNVNDRKQYIMKVNLENNLNKYVFRSLMFLRWTVNKKKKPLMKYMF